MLDIFGEDDSMLLSDIDEDFVQNLYDTMECSDSGEYACWYNVSDTLGVKIFFDKNDRDYSYKLCKLLSRRGLSPSVYKRINTYSVRHSHDLFAMVMERVEANDCEYDGFEDDVNELENDIRAFFPYIVPEDIHASNIGFSPKYGIVVIDVNLFQLLRV